MTNRFKDFGSGGDVTKTPLSFKLHGEEFSCRPNLQGKTLLDIIANASDDGAGAAKSITEFFNVALLPESAERFNALLIDPEKIVTVDALGDITAWLVEEYSSRPTQRPEHSSSGQ
jgi:hypothetical protein